MKQELVKYDSMCRAIDAAYKVDEVKDIRDKAVALEAYARQAKNIEAEARACEIRLRAERKVGQLLKPKRGGSKSRGATLKPKGISKDQSSKWQKLGAVPQADFDNALKQADKPTTNGILRATTAPKLPAIASDALWLWGRLRDFDRNLLAKTPEEVMTTLPDDLRDEVHTLAPRVAAWLKRIGKVP